VQVQALAERFAALGRVDRRVVVSGKADIVFSPESLKVDGALAVDEGLFDFTRADAPKLDADVVVIRDAEAPAEPLPPLPLWLRDSSVALNVNLGQALRIRGRGLNTTLQGDLQVTLPAGRPTVVGTVRTASGTYVAYGQNLQIERGEVAFSGPPDNPRLDILAVRPNLDVIVGVAVTGTAQNPRVRLTSEPEMSDFDKMSWLVLGRASEGLGRADTALLQRAAVALLSGEGSSPTDNFLNQIGITDFSLRQNEDDGTSQSGETVVALGRQISRRWYLGYERSVNAATGTWQLIYRIARRLTVRAQSGDDESLDVIWSWRW
jgi:translocation and assembly module TamB